MFKVWFIYFSLFLWLCQRRFSLCWLQVSQAALDFPSACNFAGLKWLQFLSQICQARCIKMRATCHHPPKVKGWLPLIENKWWCWWMLWQIYPIVSNKSATMGLDSIRPWQRCLISPHWCHNSLEHIHLISSNRTIVRICIFKYTDIILYHQPI